MRLLKKDYFLHIYHKSLVPESNRTWYSLRFRKVLDGSTRKRKVFLNTTYVLGITLLPLKASISGSLRSCKHFREPRALSKLIYCYPLFKFVNIRVLTRFKRIIPKRLLSLFDRWFIHWSFGLSQILSNLNSHPAGHSEAEIYSHF